MMKRNRERPLVESCLGRSPKVAAETAAEGKFLTVILLKATRQNVNVLLSNITFSIFAVFGV